MILKIKYLIALFCVLFLMSGFPQTDIKGGISLGSEGLKSFYFSISDYYHVPVQKVEILRERKIHEEELPVVFYIAGIAGEKPEVIVNLRLGGSSWFDISLKYGIYSNVYYVPLKSNPSSPPYGKAYGYYKNKPRKEWKNIELTDEEIINFVNLRFISEHYNYNPAEVVKMREEGKNFVTINNIVKKGETGKKNNSKGKGQSNKNK